MKRRLFSLLSPAIGLVGSSSLLLAILVISYPAISLANSIPPDMVIIPGGEFEMGDHYDETRWWCLPIHLVHVDSFYMTRYETTTEQYCDYLNSAKSQGLIEVRDGVVYATGGTDRYCYTYEYDPHSRISFNGSEFTVMSGKADHPMVEVSWFGAAAYCNWRSQQDGLEACYNLSSWNCDFSRSGYRLPTEAEWEYAARGGLEYYKYPWGNDPDSSRANWSDSGDPYETGSVPWTTPAGYYPANGYGLYDMAGNVLEWCNDWYSQDYYSTSPYDNPRGPVEVTFSRAVRGGSWYSSMNYCNVAYRGGSYPGNLNYFDGFRVVLSISTPPQGITIRGMVKDEITVLRVPYANVGSGGKMTQSNINGEYEIAGLFPGIIQIGATKIGYGETIRVIHHTERGETYNDIDLYLPEEGVLTIDSGFRPSIHGFPFNNWAPFSTGILGDIKIGGFCNGMTLAALYYYLLGIQPTGSDAQINFIKLQQVFSAGDFAWNELRSYNPLSGPWVAENYDTIRDSISKGVPCPVYLMSNPYQGFKLGHAVLAFKVEERYTSGVGNRRIIYIYENNQKWQDNFTIQLVEENGQWRMFNAYDDKYTRFIAVPASLDANNLPYGYVLHSPGTLSVTDPNGFVMDKNQSEIEEAYYLTLDIDDDGEREELAIILWPKEGEYLIEVIPDPCAEPTDTYTLEEYKFGVKNVLAENVEIQNIPEQPYVDVSMISATIDVEPDTILVDCNGVNIISYIELSTVYNPTDIEPNTVYISIPNYPGYFAQSISDEVGDYDSDGVTDLKVDFNSQQLRGLFQDVNDGETLELVVAGNLWDGTRFEGSDMATMFVSEDSTPPTISNLNADYPLVAVSQTVNFYVDVNDNCDNNVDIEWDFGDNTPPSFEPNHVYGEPDLYNVTVTATDDCSNSSTESIIIVVYDPAAGFTTGGGWFVPVNDSFIDGVNVTDTVSKANFGFIVKYKKGADNPDGDLEFQYKAGDIDLKSTDMDWLVVQSTTKVRFKGLATINGEGLYTFKVTAEDNGEPGTGDWFKIEIWTGVVDSENGPPTPKHKAQGYLGGGNIQIHQK